MKKLTIIFAAALALATGCTEQPTPDDAPTGLQRAYVLNEGSWGSNNGSLSRITPDKVTNNWFANSNQRGLGDLAQDMIHYGTTLYIAVHGSNTIECVDPANGISRKQIDMGGRGPRYMAAHNGKVYVSCYDKTIVRIDTATLAIDAACRLSGMQPEQLCIAGNKIYVCNGWQYGSNGTVEYDSTLSIVSLSDFSETGKITVGANPNRIKAIDNHRILVACLGDYGDRAATTLVIDLNDNSQTPLSVNATNFDICGDSIYLYHTTYDNNMNTSAQFYVVDAGNLTATPILEDYGNALSSAYGINVDPVSKDLFICNSRWGVNSDVYHFSRNGKLINRFETGIFASKVVF